MIDIIFDIFSNRPIFALSYFTIILSTAFLWLNGSKKISIFLFLTSLFFSVAYQQINIINSLILIPIYCLTISFYSEKDYNFSKFLYFISIIALLIIVYANVNILFQQSYLLKDYKVGLLSSKNYFLRILPLKSYIALIIAYFAFRRCNANEIKNIIKYALIFLVINILLLIPTGVNVGYIKYEFKIPDITLIWVINMIFTTIFVEEIIYRLFIQKELAAFISQKIMHEKFAKFLALTITATIFGLMHFHGGIVYMLLAFIAGLFYGSAFMLSGNRIEASMIVHFGVNFIHLIFFTYPT